MRPPTAKYREAQEALFMAYNGAAEAVMQQIRDGAKLVGEFPGQILTDVDGQFVTTVAPQVVATLQAITIGDAAASLAELIRFRHAHG